MQPGDIPTTTELQAPHEELKIKGFEIIEELGSGGMSSVYKATQVLMGRTVAVKVLHRFLLSDQSQLQRFLQEARFAKGLEHPNIAHVYSFGTSDDGRPFMVMEFCEGETLQSLIAKKQLQWKEITNLMEQICAGLAHAHKMGITHRDLKPSNIFLVTTPGGGLQVKIIDFGIAKLQADDPETAQKLTRTGLVLGTPYYMSPEQCSGEKVDSRSDLYSLGCILYEIICGQPPFLGESTLDVARKQVTEAPPSMSQVSKTTVDQAVEKLVLKSIAKARTERFQTAEEFSEALSAIGSAKGVEGKRSSGASVQVPVVEFEKKPNRTLKMVSIAAALVVVLALGGVAASFLLKHQEQHSPEFLQAHAEFNSGNYEDAAQKLVELRGKPLGEDDADALMSDLIDLGDIVFADSPKPQSISLPRMNTRDGNQATLYMASVLAEPPSNNPSQFLIYKALIEAASIDGHAYEHIMPTLKFDNVSDQDRAYLEGSRLLTEATGYQYKGKDHDALNSLSEGVKSLRSSGRATRLAMGLFRLSGMQGNLGNPDGAKESLDEWFTLLPRLLKEDERETAQALVCMAQYLGGQQRFDEADQALAHAGEIYKQKRGGHTEMAGYYRALSAVEVDKKNLEAGLNYLKQAVPEQMRSNKNPDFLVDIYNGISQLDLQLKHFEDGEKNAEMALMQIQRVPKQWTEAREIETVNVLSTYIEILAAENKKDKELPYRQELAQLLLARENRARKAMLQGKTGDALLAAAYHTASYLRMINLLQLKQNDAAEHLAEERIKLVRQSLGESRLLADTILQKSWTFRDNAARLSALEDAVHMMERVAKTEDEKAYVCQLHACLGCAYQMANRVQDALPLLEDAEKYCAKPHVTRVNWEVYSPFALANCYMALGRTKEAYAIYAKHVPQLKPDDHKNNASVILARQNWKKLNESPLNH